MQRRQFLSALPLAAAAAAGISATAIQAAPRGPHDTRLRFDKNGRFRVLSISDLHYGPVHDPLSHKLITDLIKTEKPDFVIVNGDTITGEASRTISELKDSVAQVATPMETAGIPWAVTMGNHDRNIAPDMAKDQILSDEARFALFEAWPHNMNAGWVPGITGIGNKNLLIWNAAGTKPLFNIWMLDSGKGVADRSLHYEWIKRDQIDWYMDTSAEIERRFGPIPALMFFHIPIPEFRETADGGDVLGTRGQKEDESKVNGGMFAALEERSDVIGIFCGHDHMNNYLCRKRDIALGFDGSAGVKHAYPKMDVTDPRNQKMRSGRIFEIHADQPGIVKTWLRHLDGTADFETTLSRRA